MKKSFSVFFILLFLFGCQSKKVKDNEVNVRLMWIPQAQFAGYIVAKQLGYYDEEGIVVNLHSAGPDLKPQITVANGTDQIGIAVPNQIISARTNGVPLVVVAQIFQDSPNKYVLKKENAIKDLKELKGKKVGLWLGGDEAEFISMLKFEGLTLNDIIVIPQEYSIIPFIQDKYIISMVTSYNELYQINKNGFDNKKLQIISPKNYNSAILGDVIFTTDSYVSKNNENVKKFIKASIRGWRYCMQNPDNAVDIMIKYNPELKKDEQRYMLNACLDLIRSGVAKTEGIGYVDEKQYKNIQRILHDSKQIERTVNIKEVYNTSALREIPKELKSIDITK